MQIASRPWGIVVAGLFLTIVSATHAQYSGGTGEPNDPYQIATASDLIALGETPEDYDKHFLLTADIDLDPNLPGGKVFDRAVIAPDVNDDVLDWDQNPFDGTPFTGAFDGNGHTISHLTIRGSAYLGLFGQSVGSWSPPDGEIKSLKLAHVDIISSGEFVGGLVGYADRGTVTYCCSSGAVGGADCVGGLVGSSYGAAIKASFSGGLVSGHYYVGGLVGDSIGRIAACCSSASVTGDQAIGGLVGGNDHDGRSWGSIANSYSTGAVCGDYEVGGLVGWNLGELIDCYSTGVVRGGTDAGGLVGSNYSQELGWGTATACFWDVETSGQTTSDGGEGKTTAQMQDPNMFIAAGWDFTPNDIWFEPEGGGYPILWWQLPALPSLPQFSGGTGEPNDPYRISTAAELNGIGHNRRLMECHFKLVADIDLTAVQFHPIGSLYYPYRGVFDGDNRTISNLTVEGGEYLGLFGCLGSGAEVRYLGVVDVNIVGSGDGVGGLAGSNGYESTLTHCYTSGRVSGTGRCVGGLAGLSGGVVVDCHSTAIVSGDSAVGGLLGVNSAHKGVVADCYATGRVSGTGSGVGGLVGTTGPGCLVSCSYSTGAVTGYSRVGGLVGQNYQGTVAQCYSTGRVSGMSADVGGLVGRNDGAVFHCYCTGTVSGNLFYVGWLVGSGDPEKVTSSFWEFKKPGQAASAGGTGKTPAQMQMAETFLEAGWDFVDETANGTEDIWWIDEGKDYPRLWWELSEEETANPWFGGLHA